VNNTFENHVGSHFILVKNGNNTYTLTMASGTVYEFDTSGKLTQIEDIDENSIDFTYESGYLTTITDTIGRSKESCIEKFIGITLPQFFPVFEPNQCSESRRARHRDKNPVPR
jgi:YD repeat-containing protein